METRSGSDRINPIVSSAPFRARIPFATLHISSIIVVEGLQWYLQVC